MFRLLTGICSLTDESLYVYPVEGVVAARVEVVVVLEDINVVDDEGLPVVAVANHAGSWRSCQVDEARVAVDVRLRGGDVCSGGVRQCVGSPRRSSSSALAPPAGATRWSDLFGSIV